MAGAGFKTFASGEVLTAANVNTYLMQQTVMVFADSSARSTALGANVSEGMLSYLKDTNKVEVYDGSSWVASDDPNAIQNTIVDAKGDLISATAADTPARLAVGTNGQVLAANSSTATGLEWQTISSGGMTSIASGTLSGASVSITSIPTTYNELWLYVNAFDPATDDVSCQVTFNSVTTGTKYQEWFANTANIVDGGNQDFIALIRSSDNTVVTSSGVLKLYNYKTTNSTKIGSLWSVGVDRLTTTTLLGKTAAFTFNESSSAISSIQIKPDQGNFDGGTYTLYGVK